ncbi:unnamed protein product [Schistosoma curassoni]|uniref:Threonylcarbamoyl-AMP synthase n=1 Tax=Schistosoma curassoni TaxID=6186 RepID=A0A183KUB5_9TREM|nr:unnamed protein product [Schistosoma curassoni]
MESSRPKEERKTKEHITPRNGDRHEKNEEELDGTRKEGPGQTSSNLNAIVQLISQNDGVIALPTDTIYGLACSVFNPEAIERIRRIKGRSETKPMAICLDQVG